MAMGTSSSDLPLSADSMRSVSGPEWEEIRSKNARASDPCDFGREALDVVLFPLEHGVGHKHREVGVVDAERLAVIVGMVGQQVCGWRYTAICTLRTCGGRTRLSSGRSARVSA